VSTRNQPDAPRASSLTAEEEELWSHVTKGVKPVRGKRHVHAGRTGHNQAIERRLGAGKPASTGPDRPKPTPRAERAVPTPAALDRRSVRKIATGRIEIDANIDLHGMRQTQAHAALRRFLSACRDGGCRTVLVVTGKGGAPRKTASPADTFERSDRGVLRNNVPRWLCEPELSALVIGFTAAHPRHGGDGALYVTLRKK
jgi:DNA-nicking Smr family endonuclease